MTYAPDPALRTNLLIKDRPAAAPILPHRLDELHARSGNHAAAKPDAARVLVPRGQVGHEVDAQHAAAPQHAMRRRERFSKVHIIQERLQHAVRRDDHAERLGGKRQMTNVAAHDPGPHRERKPASPSQRIREHRRGSIDADNFVDSSDAASRLTRGGRAGDGHQQSARAASQLENRPACTAHEISPKSHVAATERTRVLPIVKRRVLVPPLVAITLAHRGDSRTYLIKAPAFGRPGIPSRASAPL